MKLKYKIESILVTLFLLIQILGYSTSQQGGYITYQNIGQDSFQIQLVQYSECDVPFVFPSRDITISSSCSNSFTLPLPFSYTNFITNTCNSTGYNCGGGGGSLLGLVQHTYTDTVVLPPCNDWEFTFINCCRQLTSNFTNSSNQQVSSPITISSGMNTQIDQDNSSPLIQNPANAYVTLNEWTQYNSAAIDPDGNQLRYSLYTPNVASSTNYNALDSLINDSISGDLELNIHSGVSNNIFIFQRVYEINSNGDTLGYMDHEMRFTGITTSNINPDEPGDLTNVTGGQLTGPNGITSCSGDTICFDILLSDSNSSQTIKFNDSLLLSSLPGASFTENGQNPKTISVCWPTPEGFSGTKQFTISTADSACPIVGESQRSYSVNIIDGVSIVNDLISICKGDSVQIQALGDSTLSWQSLSGNSTSSANFSCTQCPDPTVSPSINSTYLVSASSSSSCPGSDTLTINVDSIPVFETQAMRDTICKGDTLSYSVNTTSQQISWDNNSSGINYFKPGTTAGIDTTTVQVSSGNCIFTDTLYGVVSQGIPSSLAKLSYDTAICPGDSTTITLHSGNGPYRYSWSNSLPGTNSVRLSLPQSDSITAVLTDTIGQCSDTAYFYIQISNPIKVEFNQTDTTICKNDSVNLSLEATGGIPPYNFSVNGNSTNDQLLFNGTSDSILVASAFDSEGCVFEGDTLQIAAKEPVQLIPLPDTIVTGDSAQICLQPLNGFSPFTYSWNISSSNDSCLSVSSNNHDLMVIGTVSGICGTDNDTTIITDISVGQESTSANSPEMLIYPNPVNTIVNIKAPLTGKLFIIDLKGSVVLTRHFNHSISIDLSQVKRGVHFFILKDDNNLVMIDKVVIK
ncbi:T9SS type A sorting domain-containing protein [Salibacter halophilus]|uniref:T9SS type A sorting domain-containing protein n=1 Tax=Salibacter halophilus TaxID=1803916 RepID=A0A6N6M9J8_9FLAO|nr:T9SS type A sorting domain-containing protein [Salibacter halophilus]KAB1065553.1 T9SS type A sorting domain-containing protein [Salibacter halophilus]